MAIKNIIIVLTALFSLHISAAQVSEKKFDQERYNVIKNAVDSNTGWFKPLAFEKQDNDIMIVEQHIKDLQNKIEQNKSLRAKVNSVFLSIFGYFFGLSSFASIFQTGIFAWLGQWSHTETVETQTIEGNSTSLTKNTLTTSPVLSAAVSAFTFYMIAKYLLNKANSYQKEIDELKEQIELDKHLLTLLTIDYNQPILYGSKHGIY